MSSERGRDNSPTRNKATKMINISFFGEYTNSNILGENRRKNQELKLQQVEMVTKSERKSPLCDQYAQWAFRKWWKKKDSSGRQLAKTGRADVFPLKVHNILSAVAKNASWLIFFQYDCGAVYINFKGILLCNVQGAAKLNGQHNAPQLIDSANDTGRLHRNHPFMLCVVDR